MTQLKRIFAYLVDHILIILLVILATACVFSIPDIAPALQVILELLTLLGWVVLSVLRDWIFSGRSLGKRLFGLYVYDKASGTPASPGQTVVRNLLFFLYTIDGIVLLATKETLGDRMARAVVVNRAEAAALQARAEENPLTPEEIAAATAARKKNNRRAVLIVTAVILAFLLMVGATVGITFLMIKAQTGTEEYRIAREYLVEDMLGLSPEEAEDITLVGFNRYVSLGETTAAFTFTDGRHDYEIVCHKENGVWVVCEECSDFD